MFRRNFQFHFFWGCKSAFLSAEREGVAIVFHAQFVLSTQKKEVIKEDCLFLKPVKKGESYEECVPFSHDLTRAAIVVQGVVVCSDRFSSIDSWRKTIRKEKLNVVFAAAAAHRQYPDVNLDRRISELKNKELEAYQIMGATGYSKQNPSKFLVQHVQVLTPDVVLNMSQRSRYAADILENLFAEVLIKEWSRESEKAFQVILNHIVGYLGGMDDLGGYDAAEVKANKLVYGSIPPPPTESIKNMMESIKDAIANVIRTSKTNPFTVIHEIIEKARKQAEL